MDKQKQTEKSSAPSNKGETNPEQEKLPKPEERTVVKNANAAGLGAMERSDQNFDDADPNLANY
jgi:hypothetical protein